MLGQITYPVMVKADGSWGGKFVRLAENAAEVRNAICEFVLPTNWPSLAKGYLAKLIPLHLFTFSSNRLRRICLQEFIVGEAANRAVVCLNGEVLAGISAKVVKTTYTFGPAALIKVINHEEMTRAADLLVGKLKLSGFVGFDFVFDSEGHARLIEMNPRVTPVAYLGGAFGVNLSAALYARITGGEWVNPAVAPTNKPIALFPQELQRTIHSEYISTGYDDVPWSDPRLVRELLNVTFKASLIMRWGALRRNRQQIKIDRLKGTTS